MSEIICFSHDCSDEPEYHCSCSSSIFICRNHFFDHIKQNPEKHKLELIYDHVNSETKSSVLNFLQKEMQEFTEIRAKLIGYYSVNLFNAQKGIKDRMDSLNSQIQAMEKLHKLVHTTTKISKSENDEVIKVLKHDQITALEKCKGLISNKDDYQDLFKFIYVNDAEAERIILEIVENYLLRPNSTLKTTITNMVKNLISENNQQTTSKIKDELEIKSKATDDKIAYLIKVGYDNLAKLEKSIKDQQQNEVQNLMPLKLSIHDAIRNIDDINSKISEIQHYKSNNLLEMTRMNEIISELQQFDSKVKNDESKISEILEFKQIHTNDMTKINENLSDLLSHKASNITDMAEVNTKLSKLSRKHKKNKSEISLMKQKLPNS